MKSDLMQIKIRTTQSVEYINYSSDKRGAVSKVLGAILKAGRKHINITLR